MAGTQRDSAFINIPYDSAYQDHFVAYITGVSAFGLTPRATLELTGSERRLDRIFKLISECRYSFHDLSMVTLDRKQPATPRFNMPFELGLVVGWQNAAPSGHDWFVLESSRHRLQKSLSDLNGTDPLIYGSTPAGILREIGNALVRHDVKPDAEHMRKMFEALSEEFVPYTLQKTGASSIFEPRPFSELVVMARNLAQSVVPGLPKILNT
jgi:hypothetical protein